MNTPTRILGAALALTTAACGGAAAKAPHARGAGSAPAEVLTEAEIRRVIGVVAAARQLPARGSVDFERLPRAAFVRRLLEDGSQQASADGLTPHAAQLLGFDFVPPPEGRDRVSSVREVLEEQVAGFYDHRARRIFVPMVDVGRDDDALQQRAVVAHEAQHALQDQHFSQVLRDESGNDDTRLARLALLEGDAMVAMGAYLGADHGAPVGRTLRRIADVTRKVPLTRLWREDDTSRFGRALALTRDRMRFPYEEGMLFVADLYRAGGFPLVDRAYAWPPRSTEHILHPEKYLAGEMPRPIAQPSIPKGYRSVADEALGELQIRSRLGQCLRRDQAERAAAGWDGDRFLVVASEQHDLAVGWATAWDAESDAQEFEAALREGSGCWRENRLGLAAGDYTIGPGNDVLRSGSVVAFARGLDGPRRRAWLTELVRLPEPAPRAEPISNAVIPPRVPLPTPTKGRIEGDEYRSAWLGVSARVPSGMTAATRGQGLELTISREDSLLRGALALSDRVTNAEQDEKTFAQVERTFSEALGAAGVSTEIASRGEARTPLGLGKERTWRGVGTPVEMRMILVPICAGTGSLVLVAAYAEPLARSVLDGWIESFRWINGRNVVACAYLDPK